MIHLRPEVTPEDGETRAKLLERVQELVEVMNDMLARDLIVLEMGELIDYADYFIVATGRSERQLRALADGLITHLKSRGVAILGSEGYEGGQWVLIDIGDIVIHLFLESVREFYGLERLWAEVPRIKPSPPAEGERTELRG